MFSILITISTRIITDLQPALPVFANVNIDKRSMYYIFTKVNKVKRFTRLNILQM